MTVFAPSRKHARDPQLVWTGKMGSKQCILLGITLLQPWFRRERQAVTRENNPKVILHSTRQNVLDGLEGSIGPMPKTWARRPFPAGPAIPTSCQTCIEHAGDALVAWPKRVRSICCSKIRTTSPCFWPGKIGDHFAEVKSKIQGPNLVLWG